MTCIQGMDIKVSVEDISELFNYIDDKGTNRIAKQQFMSAVSFILQKVSGPSSMDAALSRGVRTTQRGVSNQQLIFAIMKKVCDGIQTQKLSIRQLTTALDVNNTGYLTRAEFSQVCHSLAPEVSLDHVRQLMAYYDEQNKGKISIMDFLRFCVEVLNQQIGGGVFAFMQVQPVIQRIINELAVDCDRFFDDVADANEEHLQGLAKKASAERAQGVGVRGVDRAQELPGLEDEQVPLAGLSKTIFFKFLSNYGVILHEQEKALIATVFGYDGAQHADKLDYEKIDNAFEGVQQQLYAQGK